MSDDEYVRKLQTCFSQSELSHLSHALDRLSESGIYYGPEAQYRRRHDRIQRKIASALRSVFIPSHGLIYRSGQGHETVNPDGSLTLHFEKPHKE